jgi:DNA-binding MarR family transcriptional regulator
MVAKRSPASKAPEAASPAGGELRKAALLALLKAADRVRTRLSAPMEPAGLTFQQYNVLRILRGARPDGLPTMEIAARMIEQAPAITGLLDRLEAKGLVARARQSEDRRCVRATITPAGLEVLAGLDEPIERADAEALAMLNDAEIGRLRALLALVLRE